MFCNLVLLRYEEVYHLLRLLLVFVHVCCLLGQYCIEVVYFFVFSSSKFKLFFVLLWDYILRKRDHYDEIRVMINLGANKEIHFYYLKDNCLVHQEWKICFVCLVIQTQLGSDSNSINICQGLWRLFLFLQITCLRYCLLHC